MGPCVFAYIHQAIVDWQVDRYNDFLLFVPDKQLVLNVVNKRQKKTKILLLKKNQLQRRPFKNRRHRHCLPRIGRHGVHDELRLELFNFGTEKKSGL